MTGPEVSAILAVHNGRGYLRDAVDSITRQTLLPVELVVVDDGSTDGGTDGLEDLDLPFPARVERQANRGQSVARNRGVELAKADLLAFIDQDDLWHPEHLEVLCAPVAADPDVGWAYSDFDEIDAAGRVVTMSFLHEHSIKHPKRTLSACVGADLMVLPSASVLRRSALDDVGGFDEDLRGYEDDDLYVRTFRSGWRMVFVDRALTRFRVHGSSSSAGGTFADSRMRYSLKLQAAIQDDRRLNRFWFRDIVAPRFLASSLDDYVRAVSERDWEAADSALRAVEHFSRARGADAVSRSKMLVLRNPRLFRRLLQVNQVLPPPLRATQSPVFRLR